MNVHFAALYNKHYFFLHRNAFFKTILLVGNTGGAAVFYLESISDRLPRSIFSREMEKMRLMKKSRRFMSQLNWQFYSDVPQFQLFSLFSTLTWFVNKHASRQQKG